MTYKGAFLEFTRSNGKDHNYESKSPPTGAYQTLDNCFYAGHVYHPKKALMMQSICSGIAEHACKEILRPSYFLDDLMDVFVPRVISALVRQNIALMVHQKRLYAVRKLQKNQWLGVEVLSRTKLGASVVLDEHGNIVKTIQRTRKHQKKINRRRRPDTKIIAALNP